MGRFIFVSFGLLVVFPSLSGTAVDCPSGWSSYEGHCYKLFLQKLQWAHAERLCTLQHTGSHLVSFHSSAEVHFVATIIYPVLKASFIWMGLSNIWNQCSSEWSDGSCICYENLSERTSKKCVALEKWQEFRMWSNIYCGQQNPFVCKSPPQWEDVAV